MTTIWGIHNDTIPAAELLSEAFVAIGWDEIGDLREIGDDQTAMKQAVAARYPDTRPGAVPTTAGMLRRFGFEMKTGDLVVSPSKQSHVYNIGRVVGQYRFEPSEPSHRHRRSVEWLMTDAPREGFSQELRYELGSALTLFKVTTNSGEITRVVQSGEPVESAPATPVLPTRYGLLQRTVLQILEERGPLQRQEVIDAVTDCLDFNEAEEVLTGKGIPRYVTAITWGSVDMKGSGWIDKGADGWSITELGRQILTEPLSDPELARLSSQGYRESQQRKREAAGRFKTERYPLIDQAVKLLDEGQWTTYSDIGAVVGTNGPSVGEYVHRIGLDNNYRVVPVGQAPYQTEWREALEAEGVVFDHRGLPDPARHVTAEDLREQLDALGLLPKVARRAWLVRSNAVQGKSLVSDWIESGTVTLSASGLREVSPGISRADLKPIVDEDYAHASYAARAERLDDFHAFLTRMQPHHLVVTIDQRRLYIGTITDDAVYQQGLEGRQLQRSVEWGAREGVDRLALPSNLEARLRIQHDVVDLTQQLETLDGLLESELEQAPPPRVMEVVLPDSNDELATRLHVSREWLQECVDLLNDRPQLIFYGPPGTGKTFLAQAIGKHVAGDNVSLVQFHPSYSYEDFFEGFRPTEAGGFQLKPGPMRTVVDQARENPHEAFVLIIDEINRGNLAKVFGELYFLLEYRDENVKLLYADEDFSLPKNVYIIGTMNTADRSIALVDTAMRRRFAFLPLHPSEQPTRGILRSWLAKEKYPARVADLMDELNRRIDDPDFKIGPSYFMRAAVHREGGLERIWRTSILPLLEEFHFGELSGPQIVARYGLEAIAGAVDGAVSTSDADDPDASPATD